MSDRKILSEVKKHGMPGIIPQEILCATNITNEAKIIYSLLSTDEEDFPGQEWIAIHCSSSIPTVVSRLRELEARGWLRRKQRNRRNGETDLYYISMPRLPLNERMEWVQQLKKTEEEIDQLTAKDLLDLIYWLKTHANDGNSSLIIRIDGTKISTQPSMAWGEASDKAGWVYVLRAGPYYKIGMTKCVNKRIGQIKTALPFKASLLYTIKTNDRVALESQLHNKYDEYRTNGEWFELPPSAMEELCLLSKEGLAI